jgi:hypothetical protein
MSAAMTISLVVIGVVVGLLVVLVSGWPWDGTSTFRGWARPAPHSIDPTDGDPSTAVRPDEQVGHE